MARLICLSGINKGEETELPQSGEITMGRSETNAVCIIDRKASRHHCRIIFDNENGRIMLEDLNSTNGVKVNNIPVSGSTVLRSGDHIKIGETVFILNSEDHEDSIEDTTSSTIMKKQKKYDTLLQKTSFQATKTASLMKIKPPQDNQGGTGFLSFFSSGDDKKDK